MNTKHSPVVYNNMGWLGDGSTWGYTELMDYNNLSL